MINYLRLFHWFIVFIFLSATPLVALAFDVSAVRLNKAKPIISHKTFEFAGANLEDGANINGPSVIKVPNWLKKNGKVAHKDANYYLYFASHRGQYIRMAWSKNLHGPWQLYGVNNKIGMRGVLDLGVDSKLRLSENLIIHDHIASPDVFVDSENELIHMYFHAPVIFRGSRLKEQKTFQATSADGLNFLTNDFSKGLGISPFVIGKSYFRVFKVRNQEYAISGGGAIYKKPSSFSLKKNNEIMRHKNIEDNIELWEKRMQPLLPTYKNAKGVMVRPRHSTVKVDVVNNELWILYTRRGDEPEHVLLSRIDIAGDWLNWKEKYAPVEVLRPQLDWEGSNYELRPSKRGAGVRERALRDPYLFELDGSFYLFYSGAGEEAIGLARLYINKRN